MTISLFSVVTLEGAKIFLTIYLDVLVPSADNLCKQFGPSSGPTKRPARSGSKLFHTMVFLKELFEKVHFEKKNHEKLPSRQGVKYANCKVNLRFFCGRLNTCDFVCRTMSHAKSSLHWSVMHYQVTFE